MILPIPFSRAIFLYGDPFEIPRGEDVETARLRVERALNELAAEAEDRFEELWREGRVSS